jgi:hypothetical protein
LRKINIASPAARSIIEMDLRRGVIERAAQLSGGAGPLAEKLGVSPSLVEWWLAGKPIPTDIFLRAADLIFESDLEALKHPPKDQAPPPGNAGAENL